MCNSHAWHCRSYDARFLGSFVVNLQPDMWQDILREEFVTSLFLSHILNVSRWWTLTLGWTLASRAWGLRGIDIIINTFNLVHRLFDDKRKLFDPDLSSSFRSQEMLPNITFLPPKSSHREFNLSVLSKYVLRFGSVSSARSTRDPEYAPSSGYCLHGILFVLVSVWVPFGFSVFLLPL